MIDVQDRITERVNRARIELEVRRSIGPLLVSAIGMALALACGFYVVTNVGKSAITPSRELRFVVSDASSVVSGGRQQLTFKGIPAGSIDKVSLDHGQAVLTVKLERRFGAIYRDARATLRPATALQDMFLDIVDRGTASAGELTSDTPLARRRTEVSVHAEEVLNAFRPAVRAHLGDVLRGLGGGIGGRGDDLRAAFVEVVPFLKTAGQVSEQLGQHARLTRRLVHNTAVLTGELGRRQQQLTSLVTRGGTTLRTLEAGSPSLDATLAELPRVLSSISDSFTAVRGVLPDVDTALVRLRPASAQLPSGLRAARRLADAARPAVRALRRPVRALLR